MSYMLEDAVFAGDTLFMPDYGTARCDFPGGDARTLYRSIRRLLELPPQTRLLMCHDYAPGGRAYAFETTVAKERAQTSTSMTASPKTRSSRGVPRAMQRSTRRGFFCRRCRSICAPANCRRPSRTGAVISRSQSRLQLFDSQRSVAEHRGPSDRQALESKIAKLETSFLPGRCGGISAIRLLPLGAACPNTRVVFSRKDGRAV